MKKTNLIIYHEPVVFAMKKHAEKICKSQIFISTYPDITLGRFFLDAIISFL